MKYFQRTLFALTSLFVLSSQAEELWRAETENKQESKAIDTKKAQTPVKSLSNKKPSRDRSDSGNLSSEYQSRRFDRLEITSSMVILPEANQKSVLKGLNVGESFRIRIALPVIAFLDEKSPVVATITTGKFQGSKLIGESNLEKNSKKIFIDFKTISVNGKTYSFKGSAVGDEGEMGLNGKHHSQESKYFLGDFLSSFVAAYFDGLIPRTTTILGQTQKDVSVDSAIKGGLAGGAFSSAERFREKVKKAPEFSEMSGPVNTDVLILEKGQTN